MKSLMETWKDIPEYEGLYQASSYGRIRSFTITQQLKNGRIRIKDGRVKKLRLDSKGCYLVVELFKDKRARTFLVHRLITTTFFGRKDGMEVNHKNGEKTDNNIDNLEWCTHKENELHKRHILNRVSRSAMGKTGNQHIRSKPIRQINSETGGITIWESINLAALALNCDPSSIVKCCKGKLKLHKGHKWEYI